MKRLCASLALVGLLPLSAWSADWPQWRGPRRDGISRESGLLKQWPAGGPPLRWAALDIGSGYSSPSIAAGRVYVQTTRENEELALAFVEKSGERLWSSRIGKVGPNQGPQYPGTRSTPTVDGERVYCLASDGELVCLAAASGELLWTKHLRDDFSGQPGAWAYSESVLIDGDRLICTPGGEAATLAALDKQTGQVLWRSAVPGGDNAEYASIMIVDGPAARQYVQFLRKGLVGVEADTGKFLWRYERTVDRGANILTPVIDGQRVFSSGSRTGGSVVELREKGEQVVPAEIFFDATLGSGIGGAILIDGHLYGTTSNAMYCADFATGQVKWRERALGAASLCYADGRLYLRSHEGKDIALVDPSPKEYREQGRFEQPHRSQVRGWPHPVVANGGLYIRDDSTLLCFEVRE